ncbi:ribitol 5-phosphate transferase FKRP-like [Dreissena polymorpha]|uniref:Fukutin-related protein n=1 Tax=Dreissena polymorpha TaxID=45954 RepID=A0A9D4K9U2_DREPO|nr:ribitol 5-phosphate transferase FKRP-like [Dreissena polymorpha]XP_052279392.1 ribitol 5-phosphate transferase FKRP-like [Dreissena polymorpha]KAH3835638.1 hypothetical protein DPMN_108996 [Dreissena polymorpha]
MRPLKRRWKPLAAAVTVILIQIWVFSWCNRENAEHFPVTLTDAPLDNQNLKNLKPSLTVILQDFDVFENTIYDTVAYIARNFTDIDVLVISETLPYPPVKVPNLQNVKLIILKADPGTTLNATRPDLNIRSNFVLFIPDGSVLDIHFKRSFNVFTRNFEADKQEGYATPVGNVQLSCRGINFNLKMWTLHFGDIVKTGKCGYIIGEHGILLETKHLYAVSQPHLPSTFISLYAQLSLVQFKFTVTKDLHLRKLPTKPKSPQALWQLKQFKQKSVQQLYHQLGVKKVVHENEKVDWYGCHKESTRCFDTVYQDMPEFLYHGRWTPPCCLNNLRETSKHVFTILERCKVRYWLEGGSLLGAARYRDIIPWDYDVDIGIYKDDIGKCTQLSRIALESYVDDEGYKWEKAIEGDFYRVQYSEVNHLHVDIFPFYSKNGVMTKDTWFKTHRQDTEFPEYFLTPLSWVMFGGINASAPNHIRDFLEYKFGKGVIESPKYPNAEVVVG